MGWHLFDIPPRSSVILYVIDLPPRFTKLNHRMNLAVMVWILYNNHYTNFIHSFIQLVTRIIAWFRTEEGSG